MHIEINKFIYYNWLSLLHVSATYCGHLQGIVLWRIYYVISQNNLQIINFDFYVKRLMCKLQHNILMKLLFVNFFTYPRNISFKEHIPEDGLNRWPKGVGGYAYYNTINLYICLCTFWLFNNRSHPLIGLYLSLGSLGWSCYSAVVHTCKHKSFLIITFLSEFVQ